MSNISVPSADNSLQRSALNISVGDTKSIVLALQALQSKIRQLEKDRDYHHEQYENAIRSHESFKSMMEAKIEQERVAHQKREQELSELLRKALEEKTKMSSASHGNREALVHLREDLESMIATEKKYAEEREEKLLLEIQELHRIIKQEKLEHAAVLLKLEEIQKDRGAIIGSSARQGNWPIREERKNSSTPVGQVGQGQRYHHRSNDANQKDFPVSKDRKRVSTKNRVHSRQDRHFSSSRHRHNSHHYHHHSHQDDSYHLHTIGQCRCCYSPRIIGASAPPQVPYQFSYTHTYQDPTCNSMLRDVRNVSGFSPCTHALPDDSLIPETSASVPHASSDAIRPAALHPTPMIVISEGAGDVNRGSVQTVPTRSASQKNRSTPLASARSQNLVSDKVHNHRSSSPSDHPPQRSSDNEGDLREKRHPPLASTTPYAEGSPSASMSSPREKALEEEVNLLQRQLQAFLSSPALPQMPVSEMKAYFNRSSSLLERKQEQLSLLQSSTRDRVPSATSTMHNRINDPNDVISARTRQTLMNEMRAIAANALERSS